MELNYYINTGINIILMSILLLKVRKDQRVYPENQPFSRLVWSIILTNLFEALSWVFIGDLYLQYPLVGDLTNFAAFTFTAFATYFSVQQIKVIAIDRPEELKRSLMPNNFLLGATLLLLLANFGTNWVYYIDDRGLYNRGPLYMVFICACCLQYVLAIAISLMEAGRSKDLQLKHDLYKVAGLHSVVLLTIFTKSTELGGTLFWNLQGLLALENYFLVQEKRAEKRRLELQEQIIRYELEADRREMAAKQDFLAKMSHDLRTPLNGILVSAELLADEEGLEGDGKEYLEKIQSSGSYMLRLINDILDLQQMETARLKLKPVKYTQGELQKAIRGMLGPMCKSKGITLILDGGEEEQTVLVDKLRLEQLCYNILSNSVKFTPKGGTVEYRVTERVIENGLEHITMVFKDNGRGMSKEFQKNMFESFEREYKLEDKIEGSGLGLAIVKQLVALMKGSITCESEPGKGTCLTLRLTLPLATKEALASLETERLKAYSLTGYRVLIAEDNELNAMVGVKTLKKAGMTVEVAVDGEQAVQRFQEGPLYYYDAILMDIRMPKLNGKEAAMAIRSLKRPDAQLPIIALSANAFDEDIAASREAGMNAHLAKPVNRDTLYSTLGTFISRWRAERNK